MIIYTIYKVTNKINNKIYIGFDSNWPNRKNQHIYNSNCKSEKYKSINSKKLYRAFKKYGIDCFEWEAIYQSTDRNHTLNVMENYFIAEYNSYLKGYNCTLGGEGSFGYSHSQKVKSNQSKRVSENNKISKWYNDGFKNSFSKICPGDNWKLGRINQKATTLGYKWYNNGIIQKLTNNPPEDWVVGMLKR